MKKYDFDTLFAELKQVRFVLKTFSILHLVSFAIFVLNVQINNYYIYIIHYLFLFYFITFIWLKLPMTQVNKIGETILILIFGVFAVWMWIPNKKELKALIDYHYNTNN